MQVCIQFLWKLKKGCFKEEEKGVREPLPVERNTCTLRSLIFSSPRMLVDDWVWDMLILYFQNLQKGAGNKHLTKCTSGIPEGFGRKLCFSRQEVPSVTIVAGLRRVSKFSSLSNVNKAKFYQKFGDSVCQSYPIPILPPVTSSLPHPTHSASPAEISK